MIQTIYVEFAHWTPGVLKLSAFWSSPKGRRQLNNDPAFCIGAPGYQPLTACALESRVKIRGCSDTADGRAS